MKFRKGDPVRIKNNGGYGIVDEVKECAEMASVPDTVLVGFNDGQVMEYADVELELDLSKKSKGVREAIDWLIMHKLDRNNPFDNSVAQGYVQRMCDVCDITTDEKEAIYRWLGVEV